MALDDNVFVLQHMVKMSFDVVKRWVNEAQEAASSDNIMVQVSELLAFVVLWVDGLLVSIKMGSLSTVPCSGSSVPPEEKWPSGCDQDA